MMDSCKRLPKNSAKCKARRVVGLSPTKKLLHSTSEKNRRQRIKDCGERLQALLPGRSEKKADLASVLEDTVEYMKQIRNTIPQSVMTQIAKKLESNHRFHKSIKESPSPQKHFPEKRDIGNMGQGHEKIITTGMTSEGLSGRELQAMDTLQTQRPPVNSQKALLTAPCNPVLRWRSFRPPREVSISSGFTESPDECKDPESLLRAPLP